MTFRKFILIIPWLIIVASTPFFRADHPWKSKKLTLEWLDEGATPVTLEFGCVMWFCLISILLCVWKIKTS